MEYSELSDKMSIEFSDFWWDKHLLRWAKGTCFLKDEGSVNERYIFVPDHDPIFGARIIFPHRMHTVRKPNNILNDLTQTP